MTTLYTYGQPGSWTDTAARALAPDYDDADRAYRDGWAAIVDAAAADPDGYGVLAVENSLEKNVGAGKKLLVDELVDADRDLAIVDEYVQPLDQALIYGGDDVGDADAVVSHPAALEQCRETLQRRGLWERTVEAGSTAAAVERAAAEDGVAAVGSPAAADLYDAAVYERGVQDDPDNATRFLVVGRDGVDRDRPRKTSMVVEPDGEGPGVLLGVLAAFYGEDRLAAVDGDVVDALLRGEPAGEGARPPINLSDIESRERKERLGDYRFWVDAEAAADDPALQDVVDTLADRCTVDVLGSYPDAKRAYREAHGGNRFKSGNEEGEP